MKRFNSYWSFIQLEDNACKIKFALQHMFSNSILEKLIRPMFNHIINTFVELFIRRIEEHYGRH
ncbi:SRPBCC family protein [Candidatus Vallotiella sp. (ex Adelges kitamiensis)]|uniref:SRPBCC family protein n=1 Tax=Candidatus Vallotiella sp. (ex Adelges kitamiensis) TaxID=2864217 RepID=UPI0030B9370B